MGWAARCAEMIYDSLDQVHRYEDLHAGFKKAFEFLRTLDERAEEGRWVIDGDAVYAGVDRYLTRTLGETLFEAHRRYADVQVVLSGRETLLWSPLQGMEGAELVRPFELEKDVMKWGLAQEYVGVPLFPGRFVILFPEDAHAPGVQAVLGEAEEVLKVVVKVALDGWA